MILFHLPKRIAFPRNLSFFEINGRPYYEQYDYYMTTKPTFAFEYSPVREAKSGGLLTLPSPRKYGVFAILIVTTTISSLLVASAGSKWSVSGATYISLQTDRASVQTAVQIVSAILGYFQLSVVCCLINYSTRLWFNRTPQTLRARYLVPIAVFVLISRIPSALWAGAVTPVSAATEKPANISVPQFKEMSNIREWPSEIGHSGPLVRNTLGLFTYSPGIKLLGSLLASAASATPVDGRIRQHAKLDNTHFTYNGRSYGAGASVELADAFASNDTVAIAYSYQENALRADVDCSYNYSSEFVIEAESDSNIFPVSGYLPNSGDLVEYSEYYAHQGGVIVAIGVSRNLDSPQRILGIASGQSYRALDSTQCTVNFVPKLFNVFVDLVDRSINVTEVSNGTNSVGSQNLTYVTLRQFELLSNDQTSPYVSLLGDSFNTSIADYNSSIAVSNPSLTPIEASASLAGLANSVTAMLDDILVAYASAQLMVANDTILTPATFHVHAFVFGSNVYIYAVFIINTLIILFLIEEILRTRGRKGLSYFDYMDPRSLIISSSMGGKAVADKVARVARGRRDSIYTFDSKGIGEVRVALQETTMSSRDVSIQ
ncbi:hypothetical protein LARI1_G006951 [Lachnellula arida]|uniref:Uncharacterized protein n=1 Tax=Lachnellula arida TaxID=1316785 RepID=A0A8T9B8R6_9HELO|nr:hypothetical protein LARI1_G006951 [Lachnellula arida]